MLVDQWVSERHRGLPERAGKEVFPLRAADAAAIIGFWTIVALASTLSRDLDPRIPGIPARVMSAVVVGTYIEYALWAVITMPVWWLATRFSVERGRRMQRVVLFIALGILVSILVDALLFQVREALLETAASFRRRAPLPIVDLGFLDDLMVYLAILGAGITRDYLLRYRARREETAMLQAQLVQARLDALRSQLNPHFLFNTLNAMSALVERDPRGVRRMIARLSDLLRYTLDESTQQEVPLDRELDLLAEYIELMQIRFQGALQVNLQIAEEARDALVPNLVLQPIVENALKHGVGAGGDATGIITISAAVAQPNLVLAVTDNGPGPGDGTGVGLANTNARLRELYGDEYGARLLPAAGGGTRAEVTLPFRARETGVAQ